MDEWFFCARGGVGRFAGRFFAFLAGWEAFFIGGRSALGSWGKGGGVRARARLKGDGLEPQAADYVGLGERWKRTTNSAAMRSAQYFSERPARACGLRLRSRKA